ncbi:hypothetical protein B4903_21480 [Yersinia frederiksenii]|nr:hypothetical protein B4903_21480 [Yersinia frederiksenii]
MVRYTGLALPGTENGEPFGSPTYPTRMRKCSNANDMKKDAYASMSFCSQRDASPDEQFIAASEI